MINVNTSRGLEPINVEEINAAIQDACAGLEKVSWSEVATRCEIDWYDGITTDEICESTIMAAASLIEVHPNYEFVAARLLLSKIYREVRKNAPNSISYFKKAISLHPDTVSGLKLFHDTNNYVAATDQLFRYVGLKILYDRYLVRDSEGGLIETPVRMFARIAMGLALNGSPFPETSPLPEDKRDSGYERMKIQNREQVDTIVARYQRFFNVMTNLLYLPSTPTLFNAGTIRPQMASCYVQDVEDSLEGIFAAYSEQAQLSKWAGGIGTNWTKVRAAGTKIKGTNGESTGLVPWLKIQNDIAIAVNQGGKRRGSHCVYIEPWHADIFEFLDLRKPVGDDRRRTHDLTTALWIPDLFMRRVKERGKWSLFCPSQVPSLAETWGSDFESQYEAAEQAGLAIKTIEAFDLWRAMLTAKFETGMFFFCWKDACNRDKRTPGLIRSSNLCTEITLVTDEGTTAICNLGSINLEKVLGCSNPLKKLQEVASTAYEMLDAVVNGMWYPHDKGVKANKEYAPLGLGIMGLQAAEYKGFIEKAGGLEEVISTIRKSAYEEMHNTYSHNHNSHLTAIAPTVTISHIAGTTPSIEPMYSNIYTSSNLSGEFTSINRWLVEDLEALGLWTEEIRNTIKFYDGSIVNISEIPQDIRTKYKTAFEIDQKALVDQAAKLQEDVDQAISLNLYVADPSGQALSDLYMYAWESGLKTTYYLRTKAASSIEKITVTDVKVCDVSNKDEDCEACQ